MWSAKKEVGEGWGQASVTLMAQTLGGWGSREGHWPGSSGALGWRLSSLALQPIFFFSLHVIRNNCPYHAILL